MSQLNLSSESNEEYQSGFLTRNPNLSIALITALAIVSITSSAFAGFFYARNQQNTEQLNAITRQIKDLQSDIDSIQIKTGGGTSDLDDIKKKLDELESKLDDVDTNVSSINRDVSDIQLKVGF